MIEPALQAHILDGGLNVEICVQVMGNRMWRTMVRYPAGIKFSYPSFDDMIRNDVSRPRCYQSELVCDDEGRDFLIIYSISIIRDYILNVEPTDDLPDLLPLCPYSLSDFKELK